ncbi:MAG: archaellin/type IV pilin N-terminal domain-containing protein [archaeon]
MKKNSKGVSGVITVVILIALVIATVSIVWVVVNNLIESQLSSASSCLDSFDKVKINPLYTCYDLISQEVRFSISSGDINATKAIVSVSSEGATKSYTLTNEETIIDGLENYPSGTAEITLPSANSGKTYVAEGFSQEPDMIEIVPFFGNKNCGVSDTITKIDFCSS